MPSGGRRRDVAIYSPESSFFLGATRGEGISQGGGRELQMAFLADGLAREGLDTALIDWPTEYRPSRSGPGTPELIERRPHAGNVRGLGRVMESSRIWRGLSKADAALYVFRGGGPQLLVIAAFCRLHRRGLVFSAASDLDFDFDRPDRTRSQLGPYRAALRGADLIVAQREAQADLARQAGLEGVTVIPSFAEPAEPSQDDPEAFLWIGRLVPYKRPEAYLRLAESLPDVPFRMILYPTDETDPAHREELMAAAGRIPNLELLGVVPRPQLLELISRSAAVVLTSEAEGMPNVCLEAWARGVPVVSLDFDPDGKIEELGTGLVAGGSEERLSEQAAKLWEDAGLRARLGEGGREYVRTTHSPEVIAATWAKLLRGLLGRENDDSDRSQRG